MEKSVVRKASLRSALFCGASVAAFAALTFAGTASAQSLPEQNAAAPSTAATAVTQPAPAEPTEPTADRDIVVTGTRVVRDGYKAPTPTTVVGAQEIAAKAPTNLADFVNELPSLSGSSTPRTTVAAVSGGNAGINALNLRNLGVNRTLVLLDGQRVGASSLSGYIDVNQFPQALVKRVDVVTGGASADWGSDAVAGVVNFVLDKNFTGLKGEVQGGVTTYGDDRSYKVALTAGAGFMGDRGHILFSAEAAHSDGVTGIGSRNWYSATKLFTNPNYTATNGQPQLLVRPNSGFATATPGGIITASPANTATGAAANALRGIYFGEGGTPLQFNYGPIVSSNFMQGGQSQYADFGTVGDLDPRLSRQNAFGRVGFDVSDHFHVFGQISYGRSTTLERYSPQYNFGNITIKSDNAFIPATVAARVAALGIASFSLGTFNQDLGVIPVSTTRSSWRPVIGADGDFDALGSNWKWDVYGQKSITRSYVEANTTITANYNAAIDSVRNANGVIVCRTTLTNPGNGCVPYDIFGTGVNSQAAANYVKGTPFIRTSLDEDVFAGNLRGNPFSTWAGPVSIAMGIEHRRESVSGSVDALDAASQAAALAANGARVPPYFTGNYLPSFGSYHVTEGYFETVVPLAKDLPFAKTLDFNGAVRATSYSTSGFVTTWKVGLTYSPVNDITFRVTRSRDIRAPNLAELFQNSSTITSTVVDPFNANASATIFQVTSGNGNLQPEKANTLGVGVVFQPSFLPGFATSVDYFNIDIGGAIATVTAQTLINQCFAGNAAFCSQLTRNAGGVLTTARIQPINLSKQTARGLDFEASYRHPVLGGNLSLRLLATRYLKNVSDNGINLPVDLAGTNYGNGSSATSLPKWSYVGSIGWEQGPLSTLLTARGFSSGVYNTNYIECTTGCPASTPDHMTIENNYIPGAIYFDANVSFKILPKAEIFLSVDNFTNRDPAQVAWAAGGSPLSVNPALYDTLGRTFRAGFRFRL